MKQDPRDILLLALLIVTAALGVWLGSRPQHDSDATSLSSLPSSVDAWTAIDIEMDTAVVDMLRADFNVQRAYRHPVGNLVFVYLGYYGTARGGTPEHVPDICYPAQGWEIVSDETRDFGRGGSLSLREFVVRRDGEERLVHFWYRTKSVTGITSIPWLRLHHFWSRVRENRADAALVRLSTPILAGDVDSARAILRSLESTIDVEVAESWPESRDVDGPDLDGREGVDPPDAEREDQSLAERDAA